MLLDTISEYDSRQDDDDDDNDDDDDDYDNDDGEDNDENMSEQGDLDGGVSSALFSGKPDLFALGQEVLIASPSTSPSTSIAAATAKAVAAVASVTTPTRSISIHKLSPKRTPAHMSPFAKAALQEALLGRCDLPYPLGSVPTPPLAPSTPLALAGSPMLKHPIQPLSWYTKEEKLGLLELKLKSEYKRDRSLKFSAGTAASDARSSIHVFVDLSNIVIGFYNRIRADRSIPQEKKMKAPPFFFEAFSRILERDRKTVRRVTAGSAPDSNNRSSWPLYMRQADALGYEMNILSRVTKSIPSPRLRPSSKYVSGFNQGHKKNASRNSNSNGNGINYNYNNDGHVFSDMYSSDDAYGPSSPPPPSSFKLGEQGVDEILHLKMCQSLLDYETGTIVLATGDAAEAEFSDGFLKHAERALGRGWCVELLSWKMGISNAWRELERKQKGTGLFRIIELDKYSEDLLDMSIE